MEKFSSSKSIQVAFIGLGSNLGDREANVQIALDLIAQVPDTRVRRHSRLFNFAAQDVPEPQANYLNSVVWVETELGPLDLLEKLQIIERKLGRATKEDRAARPIDLDILSYGEEVVFRGKTLVIPHPRLHQRKFVLQPLVEICPDWMHPRLKKTARELLALLS